FQGAATFGPGESNQTILSAASCPPNSGPCRDIFVAKYDTNGGLIWAKRAGGSGDDDGFGIGVDALGNSYVTGQFFGSATFGPGEVNQTILTAAASSTEAFVAKYASNGSLVWVKRAGGQPNAL